MKTKFNRWLALFVALFICVPFFGTMTALAADDEEVDRWTLIQPKYMKQPYYTVEERIYADKPGKIPAEGEFSDVEISGEIRSMYQLYVSEYSENSVGIALYADLTTGEVVALKLIPNAEKNGYALLDSYINKPIYDINGEEVKIYAYSGYWSSNPTYIGASTASEKAKAELYSQVNVIFTENGQESTYTSFNDCALLDQLKIKSIRNGVRSEYTLGPEAVKYLVPRFITNERYLAITAELEAGMAEAMDENDAAFYFEKFTANYTAVEEYTSASADYIKKSIDKYGKCWQADTKGKKQLQLLESYLKNYTSYSYEQLDADHGQTGYVSTDKDPAVFKLAIEYSVDEYGLYVRCAAGNVRFDASRFKLSNVQILPVLNAGNTNNEGYALYPDGSGSIIDFKNTKGVDFTTFTTAYGQDYSFSTISGANNEVTRLPVFGMVETSTKPDGEVIKHGYLAYIEEGESLANIFIKSNGTANILQTFTAFNPRPKDSYSLSGGLSSGADAMWTVDSKRKYTKDFKLRMFILDGSKENGTTYSEMAKELRSYLLKKGVISTIGDDRKDGKKDIPLVVETLGAIDSTKRVLGVPVATTKALSTFADIKTNIIDNFTSEEQTKGNPISNIVIKLNGWADGGLTSDVPTGVDAEDVLGGNDGFKSLINYSKEKGVTVYPDFDFAYSHQDSMFDGFSTSDDLARTIDDRKAYKKQYSPVSQAYEYSTLGVISTNRMMHFYDETYSEYKKYNVGAIGVSTLGDALNSDFNEDKQLNREDSKVLVDRLLAKIQKENGKLLLSGGNIYAVKYADLILDMPLESSKLSISTASVPFISMVLHGCVEYAGTALNLAGDYQNFVLRTIENGAVPYFIVALTNASELKSHKEYSKYYSVMYSIWYQDIFDTYHTLNNALAKVRYSQIISHEFVDSDYRVAKVKYDNGTTFLINFATTDYTYYDAEFNTVYTVGANDFVDLDAEGKLVNNN